MKKSCELCDLPAMMYCESDLASLCWRCDAVVHGANFLVARHSRTLLCQVCQSPTAWSASGRKLGRTVTVCESCAHSCEGTKDANASRAEEESQGDNNNEIDYYDGDDEEDGVNQSPPPSTSSSSSEESSGRFCDVSSKRMREDASDLNSDDDRGCSSSRPKNTASGKRITFIDLNKPPPMERRRIETNRSSNSRSAAAITESLKRFHEQDMTASAAIARITWMSKNR